MNNKEAATKLAVELLGDYNVESVKFLIEWNGHDVFSPVFPEYAAIGAPVFILVKNGSARKATDKEWPVIMESLPDDE